MSFILVLEQMLPTKYSIFDQNQFYEGHYAIFYLRYLAISYLYLSMLMIDFLVKQFHKDHRSLLSLELSQSSQHQ